MAEPYSITAKIKLSKNAFQKYLKAQANSRNDYSDWTTMNKAITLTWLKDIKKEEGKDLNKDSHIDYFAHTLNDIINTPLDDILIFKYLEEQECFFYYREIRYDWYVFLRSELTALREISKYKDHESKDYIVVSNYPYTNGFDSNFAVLEITKDKSKFIKNDSNIKKATDELAEFIENFAQKINKKYKEVSTVDYFKDKAFIETELKHRYLKLAKEKQKKAIHRHPDLVPDSKNIKPLKYNYYVDDHFAYHFSQKIEGSDGPSFKVLAGTDGVYCIDKNHLYYSGNAMESVDVKNYKKIKDAFIVSGPLVFIYGKPVEGIDGESFRALSSYYFKDKNGIYGLNINFGDEKFYADELKIKNADIESFEVIYDNMDKNYSGDFSGLHYAYAKDKNQVYLKTTILTEGLEPDEFQVKGKGFFIDDKNAYYRDQLLPDSDAKSFDVNLPFYFARDKKHVYYCASTLPDVDIETFEVFPDTAYAKDKHHAFFMNKKIEDADFNSFETTSWNQAKDKVSKFYYGKRLN